MAKTAHALSRAVPQWGLFGLELYLLSVPRVFAWAWMGSCWRELLRDARENTPL